MPAVVDLKKKFVDPDERRSGINAGQKIVMQSHAQPELNTPVIPGLPDDVAKYCLALVPRCEFPVIGAVCRRWRSVIRSKEFLAIRKEARMQEEWMFILIGDGGGNGEGGRRSYWEVWGGKGERIKVLPPMPGPAKDGFGVALLNAKLLVVAGYVVGGTACVSDEVYQYDPWINRWDALAKLNVARKDFACAEVNGAVFVLGGIGTGGEGLSSVEVYDPDRNEWALIEGLRQPRWGCFACSLDGGLYVMGGRSSFTIGNSSLVEVYSPGSGYWREFKSDCMMVTAHAVLGRRLFCMEWRNQRKVAVFDPVVHAWHWAAIPISGSCAVRFCLGVFDSKLLLFSLNRALESGKISRYFFSFHVFLPHCAAALQRTRSLQKFFPRKPDTRVRPRSYRGIKVEDISIPASWELFVQPHGQSMREVESQR